MTAYNPPTGAATANDPYVGKNVAAGQQGSKIPPKAVEAPQRELVNALMAAGLSPTNNDFTQLIQAISVGLFLGTFGGSANALAVALPTLMPQPGSGIPYQIPALVPGMKFHGMVGNNDNTGPASLNLSGLASAPGFKAITRKDGVTALQAGDLAAYSLVTFQWDGTVFRFVGATASDSAKATTYFGADTGTLNTLVVNSLAYGSSLQIGRPILVLVSTTNTGAATLNVNGLGAKAIKRPSGFGLGDVKANDLRSGQLIVFVYDGTSWQVQSPLPGKQYAFFNQKYASAGGIMSAADMGTIVQMGVSTGGAYTITLPAQGGTGNGETLTFFHNGNTTNVLQCAGSDKLAFPDGSALSSITLSAGDTLELTSTAATGNWIVTGGSIFTRYSSDFAKLLGASGYQKLPGGLILQWGQVTTTSAGATYAALPVSFAGAGFSIVINDTGTSDYVWSAGFNGPGSIVFYAKNPAGNYVSGAQGQFIAIGR